MVEESSPSSADEEPPKIVFPCPDYPIKIMGYSGVQFREHVLQVVEKYAPGFDASMMEVRDSSGGKYQAITLRIMATGEDQLAGLNEELRLSELVKLVL